MAHQTLSHSQTPSRTSITHPSPRGDQPKRGLEQCQSAQTQTQVQTQVQAQMQPPIGRDIQRGTIGVARSPLPMPPLSAPTANILIRAFLENASAFPNASELESHVRATKRTHLTSSSPTSSTSSTTTTLLTLASQILTYLARNPSFISAFNRALPDGYSVSSGHANGNGAGGAGAGLVVYSPEGVASF